MLFIRRCCASYRLWRAMSSGNKNHYDSLGVKSTATQGEIKTAYYELSKQFHPDTNKGSEESLNKFRQVTDAYEILGNVKSRKMYDRGLVVGSSGTVLRQDVPDDPATRFYKQREKRDKVPTPTDRTTVYDFDAWTKAHYSVNAARKANDKKMYNHTILLRKEFNGKMDVYRAFVFALGVLFFTIALSESITDRYDRNNVKNKKTKGTEVT